MKNTFFCACFFITSFSLRAQEPLAKMVVGFETGIELLQSGDGIKPHPMPGLHVEYPFHKFSFGVGITRKAYPEFRYYTFTGNISSVPVAENDVTVFEYADRLIKPVYWSIPIRINFRLPCNCVYIHAATSFDFFDTGMAEKTEMEHWYSGAPTRTYSRRQFFKSKLQTYELGVGFKLHSSDYFRLVARPSYVWSENPAPDGKGVPAYLGSLRMTFGIQYAFVRYGGKQ